MYLASAVVSIFARALVCEALREFAVLVRPNREMDEGRRSDIFWCKQVSLTMFFEFSLSNERYILLDFNQKRVILLDGTASIKHKHNVRVWIESCECTTSPVSLSSNCSVSIIQMRTSQQVTVVAVCVKAALSFISLEVEGTAQGQYETADSISNRQVRYNSAFSS